ncbi:glycosyltransferase family 4 protein [Halobacillus seohaensis]|uniref:Glycosyltransferase family 4 protein n=1 Tax=Halobacillus seohaensis TaxID=447421 RepID=A0ABW2EM75_9BACI
MKILYVTTISNTMRFFTDHINMLLDQGHTVDFACNIVKPINSELVEHGCRVYNIEFQRKPLKKKNAIAYRKLKRIIKDEKYDVVHTHTPIAAMLTRLACKNMKDLKVIYTAHGFHFFKGAPFKNWLLYFPVEWWFAKYTDVLITINNEDYTRVNKFIKTGRIEYVPGVGLNTDKITGTVVDKNQKKSELGVNDDAIIVLSVGELNKNKNHETVIKALARLNNPKIMYLICGVGPLEKYLRGLIKELGMERQIKLMGYRTDIIKICLVSDVFVFPSYREGLSVALMEAMASGLAIVCSNIRGNSDLIDDNKGGTLVEPYDIDRYCEAIKNLYGSLELRENFGEYNKTKIKHYSTQNVLAEMKRIYQYLDYQQH